MEETRQRLESTANNRQSLGLRLDISSIVGVVNNGTTAEEENEGDDSFGEQGSWSGPGSVSDRTAVQADITRVPEEIVAEDIEEVQDIAENHAMEEAERPKQTPPPVSCNTRKIFLDMHVFNQAVTCPICDKTFPSVRSRNGHLPHCKKKTLASQGSSSQQPTSQQPKDLNKR